MNKPVNKPLRVIVGDANPVDAKLLHVYLKSLYADVVCAQNGNDIIAAVTGTSGDDPAFDVVILNRTLRASNGIETARLLRDTGYAGRIIGTTADMNPDIKASWIGAGANATLTKPIDHDDLVATVVGSIGSP